MSRTEIVPDTFLLAATQLTEQMGNVGAQLGSELKRLDAAHIPVDIRLEPGLEVLGLSSP